MFGFLSSLSTVAITKGLEDAWKNKEFVDITVQVSDTTFDCHSLVLAVCSGFFKAHLKTNAEPERRHVTLCSISAETFNLILTMFYSGTNCINKDTASELWHAAHYLQIPFLMSECEKFITSFLSLDNYKTAYTSARQLDRPQVLNCILNFIANNFNSCNDFLPHLSGDEMLRVLKNEDLEVKSEHDVVDAILRWIDYPSLVVGNRQTKHDSDITDVSNEIGVHENEVITKEERNNKFLKDIKRAEEIFQLNTLTENFAKAKNIQSDVNENNILNESSKNSQETLVATKSYESQNECALESIETSEKCGLEPYQHVAQSISQQPLDSDLIPCDHLSVCERKRFAANYKANLLACQTSQECISEDRLKYLVPLLQASKTCLLTPQFLGQMYCNKFIACNKEARDIIFKATLYQSDLTDQGQWPTAAIHRKSSNFENVGLFIDKNGYINILSYLSKKWHKISSPKPFIYVVQITVLKDELYALWSNSESDTMFHLYVWKGLHWLKISDISKDKSPVEKTEDGMNVFSEAERQPANSPIDPTSDKTKVLVNKDTESPIAPFSFPSFFASTNRVENYNQSGFSFSVSTPPAAKTASTTPAATTPASTIPSWNSFRFPSPSTNIIKEACQPTKAAAEVSGVNFSTSQNMSPFSFNTVKEKGVSPDTSNKGCESVKKSESLSGQLVSNSIHLISYGNYIYIIHSSQIHRIDPKFPDASFEIIKICLANEKIEFVSSFDELLLVFCSDAATVNKTVIYAFDTNTEEARKLTVLDGPASGLVTFQDDDNRYLLQSNGALWTITRLRDNSIDFGFLIKLWDFEYKLNGGIFYNGELFLHSCSFLNYPLKIQYPDRFRSINMYGHVNSSSRFVPLIILKKILLSPQVYKKKDSQITKRHYINHSITKPIQGE